MFLDQLTMNKIRMQLNSADISFERRLTFLIMSGSFNPVHTEHVYALEVARKHAESIGCTIVGGFLAPSNESYVKSKYGSKALSFLQRRSLCELAVKHLPWLSVCSKAELSSNFVRREIASELESSFADVFKGRRLDGVEVMGSDTVLRIFGKILIDGNGSISEPPRRERIIYWLARAGPESATQRIKIQTLITPEAAKLGIEFIAVGPRLGDRPLSNISSNTICKLASKGDWVTLRSTGWLAPAVIDALESWATRRK
jgi:hypothetical protein